MGNPCFAVGLFQDDLARGAVAHAYNVHTLDRGRVALAIWRIVGHRRCFLGGGVFNLLDASGDTLAWEDKHAGEPIVLQARHGIFGEEFAVGVTFVDRVVRAAPAFEEAHEERLEERMKHISDTFSEYLLFLISNKNMTNSEVWKRAIVDKKVFSKIKNNRGYHPQKLTALCLCVGARLNLDETRDLLARAGYALSPCDKTDIIFSYFIENGIYDMIELDIQLEEHGLPCIIS